MNAPDDFAAGSERAPPPAGKRAQDPSSATPHGDWLATGLRIFEELRHSAGGLLEVQADRLRLSARSALVRAALGAGLCSCALAWLVAATLAILRGLRGGLTQLWGGREWLGDLSSGLVALALAAGVLALHLHLPTRRELQRLKAKYERMGSNSGETHDPLHSAENGARAPRPGGGAGAPATGGNGAAHG